MKLFLLFIYDQQHWIFQHTFLSADSKHHRVLFLNVPGPNSLQDIFKLKCCQGPDVLIMFCTDKTQQVLA
jgi:hypothetical protein